MSNYKVTVVHYGHPALKGAWHYALALYNQPASPTAATIFQLTRAEGARNFEFTAPTINVPSHASAYQGELPIGQIPATDAAVQHFGLICKLVNIQNETPAWNCQNWVAEVLQEMAKVGLEIRAYEHNALVAAMNAIRK
ncbi:hypothetical protein M408DRAFT_22654 [Serendipita vermifera MAFF 305830]|uniref:Uncharacterized protein n=1 Tax=Serendipita vermifera MAFF 305830 TaxID=933852 RepID=A0A0C3BCE4_SERVB|nr:hypothetical protein M408DRAFT_22654 [Serendipita vermifera MAFF 305830]